MQVPQGYTNWKLSPAEGTEVWVGATPFAINNSNPNPIGKAVYINPNTQANYFDIKFGEILQETDKTVRIIWKADTPLTQNAPWGGTFEIYAYDDLEDVRVIARQGNVAGNPSNYDTLNVIAANAVNSVLSELEITSQDGSFTGEGENVVMVGSILNQVNYYMKHSFAPGNRGINMIVVEIPAGYGTPSDIELTDEADSEITLEDIRTITIEDKTYLRVYLENTITQNMTTKLKFKINAPAVTDDGKKFTGYGKYHFGSYAVGDDGFGTDFMVQALEGNATEFINTSSVTVKTVATPAINVNAEISTTNMGNPSSTNINKEETFTLTVRPEILGNNSGVNKVRMTVPGTLSNHEITEVRAKGVLLVKDTTYTEERSANTYTLVLTDRINSADPNKRIEIKFTANTGENPVYTTNEVTVYVTDTENDRAIKAKAGNAGATIPTSTLNIEIRAIATQATALLNPNFMQRNSDSNEFELTADFGFNTRDYGVKIIKLTIPGIYDTGTDTESSTFKVNGTNYQIIKTGFPAAGQVLMQYSEITHEIKLTIGETLNTTSQIKYTFKLKAPADPYEHSIKVELEDSGNDVIQEVEEKYAGSLAISTENAQIVKSTLKANVEVAGEGKWKVKMVIPFNVRMDTYFPGLELYLNSYKAKITKYTNRKYPTEADKEVGVIEAEVEIPYDRFTGGSDNILNIKNIRDDKGNALPNLFEAIETGYGIAMAVFVNPVDRRSLTIVTKQSEPLKTGHTLVFEAREFQGTPARIAARKKSADVFTGVYKIQSDGRPIISASIYDATGTRVKLVSKEYAIIMTSPEQDKEVKLNEKITLKINKTAQKTEEMLLVRTDREYENENVGIEIKQAVEISSTGKFEIELEIE
ncbi:MAG: hypothetical protein M0R38_13400, partial [Bacteroidia bacterium]|nr:hypothetical protein [Bacteroidia bacterium]